MGAPTLTPVHDAPDAADTSRNSVTHRCGGCPRTWAGLAEAHCASCHQTFGSVTGFDKHRYGGICLWPADIRRAGGQRVYDLRVRTGGSVWVLARVGGHWKGAA